MALRDIAHVTKTLMNIVERSFKVPENFPPAATQPRVMAEPPMRTKTDGIGVFLYHITENAHYKNLPSPGYDTPPVRFSPMALTLYYQLSAYKAGSNDEQDPLEEQKWMAVAMKGLHDYPEITDSTIIEGAVDMGGPITDPVFPLDIVGAKNRFRIVYQPIQPSEAVSFWNTGESKLTLSAYYEVSVILLEPETSRTLTGRVLDYNVFTFVSGNPKIFNSYSEVRFTSPADGITRTLILTPAQVAPAPVPAPVDLVPHTLTLKGIDFNENVFIRLTNALWDTPGLPTVAWAQVSSSTTINLIVQESAAEEGTATPLPMLPGIYGAQAVLQSIKAKGDGSTWPIELTSNVSPFMVTPFIASVTPPGMPGDPFVIDGYCFTHQPVPLGPEYVKVKFFLGPYPLTAVAIAPAAGQYRILDNRTIHFQFPSGLTSGEVLPLRIIANGAENSPLWVTVP